MSTPASTDVAATVGASRWTVAIFALIGLGAALVLFAARTPTYEAEALVVVVNPVGPLEDEIAVVTGPTVLGAATSSLGFQPDVTVTAAESSGFLTLTATDDNARDAAEAVNTVANVYVQAQLGAAASVARPAEVPTSASGLSWPYFAIIGTALGALLGVVMSFMQISRVTRAASESRGADRPASGAALPSQQELLPPSVGPRSDTKPPDDFSDLSAALDDLVSQDYGETPTPDPAPTASAAESVHPFDQASANATIPVAEPAPPASTPEPLLAMEPAPAPSPEPLPALEAEPGQAAPARRPDATSVEPAPLPEPVAASPDVSPPPTDPLPEPQTIVQPMESTSPAVSGASSFSDAATSDQSTDHDPIGNESWLSEPSNLTRTPDELFELDRLAMQSQFESARYELVLEHDEQMARLTAEHERQTSDLRGEIGNLNKQVRMQAVRLKNRTGTDQTRVGDLEAQVDALEVELAELRKTLEAERISHTTRMSEEQGAADRALDNARRLYREELAKHVYANRQSMTEHRSDLDRELAEDRARHAAALEEQHATYERELDAERDRAEKKLTAATERHEKEQATLRESTRQELERQAAQHKETITSLRGVGENSDTQLREIEKENRMLRVEITSLQKQGRHNDNEHASIVQRLSDELAIMRGELEGERERNAALRADVLRRSAEAHQAIDQAVEERTAQLSELEASVARQRDYADARVREISSAAEEQAREAATREANLTATISRLKREIEGLQPK